MKKLAIVSLLLVAACSPAKKSGDRAETKSNSTDIENAFRGVMQDRSSDSKVAALYVEKCSMCHRQMGMGTVLLGRRMKPDVTMLEARKDLTAEYITLAVRQGIGNMPRISKAEVSDEQLVQIIGYLAKGDEK